MQSIKSHQIIVNTNKYGYQVYVVTDCDGKKIKITQCSATKQKCEAAK